MGEESERDLSGLLEDVRYDLIPFEGFEDALLQLPSGASVAITLAPELGVERTVERAELASEQGFEVAPHIAARFIRDEEHLDEIAGRLAEAGVTDIFVPGGDRETAMGPFDSAYDLLVALEELGYTFEEVGIGGYPTGHDFIDQTVMDRAIERKTQFATYIVTQLCFDATAIREWIQRTRSRGIDLPVEPGIPGVVSYPRLMRMAWKYGVASPLRFVRKTTGLRRFLIELARSRGRYAPDTLVDGLAPIAGDPEVNLARLRFYTFNQTGMTESWRRNRLPH